MVRLWFQQGETGLASKKLRSICVSGARFSLSVINSFEIKTFH